MVKVNYNDLLKEVSEDTGYSFKDVKAIVNSFVRCIKQHILKNNEVNILAFCKFKLGQLSSRKAYNFQQGEVTIMNGRWLPKCEFVRDYKQQFNKQA